MKLQAMFLTLALAAGTAAATTARDSAPGITGDYLEVRSCDIYTGPCVGNAEMGLAGKEGILVWSVRDGSWNGTALDGLSVIAVVRAEDTLGNQSLDVRSGPAVLIVDAKATSQQRQALADFARSMAGALINETVNVQVAPIETTLGTCSHNGCATVKAGDVVTINTRCLGGEDHLCGNEEVFYPPLTEVSQASPAYTELVAFTGAGLDLTWQSSGQRSAFIAQFQR